MDGDPLTLRGGHVTAASHEVHGSVRRRLPVLVGVPRAALGLHGFRIQARGRFLRAMRPRERSGHPLRGAYASTMQCLRRALLLAVIAIPAGVGTAEAAIWYVAPGGSGSACDQLSPCGSLDIAYDRASPGDRVQVAAGTYGPQVVTGDKGSAIPVVIEPSPRATVQVAGPLGVDADHVTIRGMWASERYGVSNGRPEDPIVGVRLESVLGPTGYFQNVRDFTLTGRRAGGQRRCEGHNHWGHGPVVATCRSRECIYTTIHRRRPTSIWSASLTPTSRALWFETAILTVAATLAEVVPVDVEVEAAVLRPRPLRLGEFGAFKSIRDRRNRREEEATRRRGRHA